MVDPAYPEYPSRVLEQRDAIAVLINPALLLLERTEWLAVQLQARPINTIKVICHMTIK